METQDACAQVGAREPNSWCSSTPRVGRTATLTPFRADTQGLEKHRLHAALAWRACSGIVARRESPGKAALCLFSGFCGCWAWICPCGPAALGSSVQEPLLPGCSTAPPMGGAKCPCGPFATEPAGGTGWFLLGLQSPGWQNRLGVCLIKWCSLGACCSSVQLWAGGRGLTADRLHW